MQRDFLVRSLPIFTQLHTLKMNDVGVTAFLHVAECVSLCSKLKKLAICGQEVHQDFNLFASSKNIEWLKVSLTESEAISEIFLVYLSCNLLELKYIRGDYII